MEQVTGQWSVNQGRSSPTWRKAIEEKSAEEQMTRSIRLLPFHLKQVFSPNRSPFFLPLTMCKSDIMQRFTNFLPLSLEVVSLEFLKGMFGSELVGISTTQLD